MPGINEEESILEVLQTSDCTLQGQFVNSSNYTFFLDLTNQQDITQAVYKPVRGETPLWDFATGTLAKREVAAYLVSEALGWQIVPPTVFRTRKLPFGKGSVQLFIEHNPENHYFNLSDEQKQKLKPVAVFDFLINNADRKGSHILITDTGRVLCIDHGVCFHVENKLRTVIWDFAGQPIPHNLLDDISTFVEKLQNDKALMQDLKQYLRVSEIKAMIKRGQSLIESKVFPTTDNTRRQYPWPPV